MSGEAAEPLGPYEAVPYPGAPHPETHPDRLAVIATLFGLEPAPPERCRVLELGCGDGGNLIPMAFAFPESRFLGVDLCERATREANARTAALGLSNIEIRRLDFCELAPAPGSFDYLIAHGVYSWVPRAVRGKIFALARRALAPHGVAYVSYNTYPGGYLRRMVREMMLYHARDTVEPLDRVAAARELLSALAAALAREDAYGTFLRFEAERLRARGLPHLYHDELADVYEPVYFHEFIAEAGRYDLQYLGEANYFDMCVPPLPAAAQALFDQVSGDVLAGEQYLDFLRCRAFRRTLLCRKELPLVRTVGPERLGRLHVASPFTPKQDHPDVASEQPEEFAGPAGRKLLTAHPLSKAVLCELAGIWPAALAFGELLARIRARSAAGDAPTLAEMLLQAYAAGAVELHVRPPRLAARPGPRPLASSLARRQAESQNVVTTLRHTAVRLEGPLERRLLRLLDGTRDREALLKELGAPGLTLEQLEACLERMARIGLMLC